MNVKIQRKKDDKKREKNDGKKKKHELFLCNVKSVLELFRKPPVYKTANFLKQ
jgi:hypothetical protein